MPSARHAPAEHQQGRQLQQQRYQQPRQSSLASLLLNLNAGALSSISATLNGTATLVTPGSAAERYFKAKHLENNYPGYRHRAHQQHQPHHHAHEDTAVGDGGGDGSSGAGCAGEGYEEGLSGVGPAGRDSDGGVREGREGGEVGEEEEEEEGVGAYVEGEQVMVVAVRVRDGRIADWKGGVKDWKLAYSGRRHAHHHAHDADDNAAANDDDDGIDDDDDDNVILNGVLLPNGTS